MLTCRGSVDFARDRVGKSGGMFFKASRWYWPLVLRTDAGFRHPLPPGLPRSRRPRREEGCGTVGGGDGPTASRWLRALPKCTPVSSTTHLRVPPPGTDAMSQNHV